MSSAEETRAKARDRVREWYHNNRERAIEYKRRYKEKNKDKVKLWQSKYRRGQKRKDWLARNTERVRAGKAKDYNKNGRRRYYAKKYGLSLDEVDSMRNQQGGRCAICQRAPGDDLVNKKKHGKLFVDHDHMTNRVRGLLCHHCNVGLGHFGESRSTLASAISYLSKAAA